MSTDRALPSKDKLAAARREGRVARSSELVAAGSALVTMVVLYSCGSGMVLTMARLLKASITDATGNSLTIDSAAGNLNQLCLLAAVAVVPTLLLIACGPVLLHWLQFGFLFVPHLIRPRLERIGERRSNGLTSVHTWTRGSLNLVKLVLVTGVVGYYLQDELPGLLRLMTLPTTTMAVEVGRTIARFGVVLACVLLLPGILDYLAARWKFTDELRMTREEVREEQRASSRS